VQSAAQALFFDVMALKADQHCSTSLLPQWGHRMSASSQSTRDKTMEKSFLQLVQKNSQRGMSNLLGKGVAGTILKLATAERNMISRANF
jgi:hypothetical protein